jgi:hypothetical protein
VRVFSAVSVNPSPAALPGFGTLQSLVDAVAAFALLGCLAAAILGGVMWAFGASSSNPAAASKGQKTVGGAIIGAVIIGASAILINFFYNTGSSLH